MTCYCLERLRRRCCLTFAEMIFSLRFISPRHAKRPPSLLRISAGTDAFCILLRVLAWRRLILRALPDLRCQKTCRFLSAAHALFFQLRALFCCTHGRAIAGGNSGAAPLRRCYEILPRHRTHGGTWRFQDCPAMANIFCYFAY